MTACSEHHRSPWSSAPRCTSLVKALGILGLGRNRIVRVPVDDQGRMRAAEMPRLAGPTIVCAQAGNVNTGAIDPLGEICERAEESGAWVHVDGAFGLWAAAVPSLQGLTAGVENADSWATDAHKWLNVPYDSGLAFVRDPDALRAAMSISAEYLPPAGGQRNPSDYTPEMSRRGRGVEVWAALMSLGRSGLVELIERNCRLARRFATELSAAGFAILNDVVLNQVLVSFGDVEVTDRIVAAIQDDGTCWCTVLARQTRHADQRQLVGHHRRRRHPQRRGHHQGCPIRVVRSDSWLIQVGTATRLSPRACDSPPWRHSARRRP